MVEQVTCTATDTSLYQGSSLTILILLCLSPWLSISETVAKGVAMSQYRHDLPAGLAGRLKGWVEACPDLAQP